jgi:TatD DNase family protein
LVSLTDTHCHLYLPQFYDDRKTVIQQAIDAGINRILVPGIDIKTSEQAINLCAIYPKVLYAAIGIHPNSKNDFNEKAIEQLKVLAKSEHVVAIGEIGLDYYRLVNSIDLQKFIFESQLELASELGLPVCIHNRDASKDVIEIVEERQALFQKRTHQSMLTGVFHSFNGSLGIANKILRLGFYLGITGPITYPSNHKLRNVIKKISIEKILVETDAPYLTPQPFRGQRNLPFYVKYVAQQISEIYPMDIESVKIITSKNAGDLFNWQ